MMEGSLNLSLSNLARQAKDGKHGASPLHWASSKELVNFLLEHGADVGAFSETTETPLHVFTRKTRLECALALLARRPDAVHQRGPDGNTPLHLAVLAGLDVHPRIE